MKRIVSHSWLVVMLLAFSCSIMSRHHTSTTTTASSAIPTLTGWLTEPQLLEQIPGLLPEKDGYQPNTDAIKKLASLTKDVEIIVFLGSWCPDSRREVPRFLRIIERTGNPHIKFRLLGLDRSKRDSAGLAEKYRIEFVPTFVVLYENGELGRITESPIVSIEQDLVEILASVL